MRIVVAKIMKNHRNSPLNVLLKLHWFCLAPLYFPVRWQWSETRSAPSSKPRIWQSMISWHICSTTLLIRIWSIKSSFSWIRCYSISKHSRNFREINHRLGEMLYRSISDTNIVSQRSILMLGEVINIFYHFENLILVNRILFDELTMLFVSPFKW